MAKCSAGNCSKTCTNGCSCISESANPANCNCSCSGGSLTADQPFEHSDVVDVDINDLRTVDTAIWLDANLAGGGVMIPATNAYKCVSLSMKGAKFSEVLKKLGLERKGSDKYAA